MGLHATFFCGDGEYKEIWGDTHTNPKPCSKSTLIGDTVAWTVQDEHEVFTIFCAPAYHHPHTWSLAKQTADADIYTEHWEVINAWKQSVRALFFYHESIHWKRISKPWAGRYVRRGTKPGDDLGEQYGFKEMKALSYKEKLINAENWVRTF